MEVKRNSNPSHGGAAEVPRDAAGGEREPASQHLNYDSAASRPRSLRRIIALVVLAAVAAIGWKVMPRFAHRLVMAELQNECLQSMPDMSQIVFDVRPSALPSFKRSDSNSRTGKYAGMNYVAWLPPAFSNFFRQVSTGASSPVALVGFYRLRSDSGNNRLVSLEIHQDRDYVGSLFSVTAHVFCSASPFREAQDVTRDMDIMGLRRATPFAVRAARHDVNHPNQLVFEVIDGEGSQKFTGELRDDDSFHFLNESQPLTLKPPPSPASSR